MRLHLLKLVFDFRFLNENVNLFLNYHFLYVRLCLPGRDALYLTELYHLFLITGPEALLALPPTGLIP